MEAKRLTRTWESDSSLSIFVCEKLWKMPEGLCMCVWNIRSPPLPAGTLCTWSWIGPRLALLPLISPGCSTPSARRALVTCLTCSTGLDHTPSYIPAPHLHCTEWHFRRYTHTHTHICSCMQASAGSESLREQAAQPSGHLFALLCAWGEPMIGFSVIRAHRRCC